MHVTLVRPSEYCFSLCGELNLIAFIILQHLIEQACVLAHCGFTLLATDSLSQQQFQQNFTLIAEQNCSNLNAQ